MTSLPIIVAVAALAGLAAALFGIEALRGTARALLGKTPFLAAVIVLGSAALGLNAATSFLKLHFKKLPVPLPVRSLSDPADGIPAELGSWVQVSKDQPVDPEVQQVLATDQYLFRDYIDTRTWRGAKPRTLKNAAPDERDTELLRVETSEPESVLRVALTYYTGMADTVAHIPERCMVADGYEPSSYETKTIVCGVYPDGTPRQVSIRLIHFEDQTGHGRVSRDVAYLFHVDGAYECDSLAVRRRLQSLSERYGYYAKVELMATTPVARDEAQHERIVAAMRDFLTAALPEVEKRLPDWKRLHAAGPS